MSTPSSEESCGYPFRSGESYLVYASKASMVEGEGMEVLLCGETKRLSGAGADLEALGNGKTPGVSVTLPDTSGGISALSMVGLAVLATAVSFILVLRFARSGQAD